ncbi:MAG: hypothetical protein HC828_12635 [Blastochloris sp.]|nr:hypothetical protein [Blastochloris sp.]
MGPSRRRRRFEAPTTAGRGTGIIPTTGTTNKDFGWWWPIAFIPADASGDASGPPAAVRERVRRIPGREAEERATPVGQ